MLIMWKHSQLFWKGCFSFLYLDKQPYHQQYHEDSRKQWLPERNKAIFLEWKCPYSTAVVQWQMQASQIWVLWISCFSNVHRYDISVCPYLLYREERKQGSKTFDPKNYLKNFTYKHFTEKKLNIFLMLLIQCLLWTFCLPVQAEEQEK